MRVQRRMSRQIRIQGRTRPEEEAGAMHPAVHPYIGLFRSWHSQFEGFASLMATPSVHWRKVTAPHSWKVETRRRRPVLGMAWSCQASVQPGQRDRFEDAGHSHFPSWLPQRTSLNSAWVVFGLKNRLRHSFEAGPMRSSLAKRRGNRVWRSGVIPGEARGVCRGTGIQVLPWKEDGFPSPRVPSKSGTLGRE